MNILLCIDDFNWNYTRHCAVTILSLLETNKNHKIKIFIISSYLSEENKKELKRIVTLYNQEIEFIVLNDIIPKDIKDSFINRRDCTRATFYRLFFPLYIKNIDRLLYLDPDVLVIKDINDIYNMDMKWKTIAWYYDIIFSYFKLKQFWLNKYINAWVLLFDAKKYDVNKFNKKTIEEINDKYWKYISAVDQDYLNIIFKDEILITKQWINYQIINKYFNGGINKAKILHCLQKPYIQYSNIPKKYVNLYYHYLNKTKWKWYPKQKANYWYLKHIYNCFYTFCSCLIYKILWEKLMGKLIIFMRKIRQYKK